MVQDWIQTEVGQKPLGLALSRRPAWLWTADAERAVWRNNAARIADGMDTVGDEEGVVPIRGQVKRLIRLGFEGHESRARIQVMKGSHAASLLCTCTPVRLADGERALLCVGEPAVAEDRFNALDWPDPRPSTLMPHLQSHLFTDAADRPLFGSAAGLAAMEKGHLDGAGLKSTQVGGGITLVEFGETDDTGAVVPEDDAPEPETGDGRTAGHLTRLLERFDADSSLYAPLGPEDEEPPEPVAAGTLGASPEDQAADEPFGPDDSHVDPEDLADLSTLDGTVPPDEFETVATGTNHTPEPRETEVAEAGEPPEEPKRLWRVTGRGFSPLREQAPAAPARETVEAGPTADDDAPDRTRTNFDRLARILADRVGREAGTDPDAPAPDETPPAPKGERVELTDAHLVLNRLPLGILIFRDQDIVFANRTMADLLGCSSATEVRGRGLDSIFPRLDETGAAPGPVTVLLDNEGTHVPVNARLQSVSWQGQPALMLSARREAEALPLETAVRAFAQTLGTARGEGFIEISRAGMIEGLSGRATEMFARKADLLIGRPLALFIDPREVPDFRRFLEEPARRAESGRPSLVVHTVSGLELTLFAEGGAGIVTGYFGLVRPWRAREQTRPQSPDRADPRLLSRLSRGVRRPLNTIVGFAQLIESQIFGEQGDPRYVEYARDIHAAGEEITGLIDELDQYARLQDDKLKVEAAPFDLAALLGECETVVRQQAGRRQVFVRSAISEDLPWIDAERASMRQAILNLLASAIDQTPRGKKVILSAQVDDDRSVAVHVRDSSQNTGELAERFAVFREAGARRDEAMVPLKSSIGLSLTRSLLAVNACSLAIDPSSGTGTLMTLTIPPEKTSARVQSAE